MRNNLTVSSPPHIYGQVFTRKIMRVVAISLAPAGLAGVFIFGLSALWVIILGVASALITEAALQALTRRKVSVLDGSAFLTGLLLAYNLPAHVPFWIPVIGSFFAVAVGKQLFGELGHNIFNPALTGRVFLMTAWPRYMVAFTRPLHYDAVTSATPLTILKEGKLLEKIQYWDLFLGKKGGCIGEVCILALVLGAIFLLARGYISWHIPLPYIATVGLFAYVFSSPALFSGDWLFHILSGGLVLGACFMATDYATSPRTRKGQVVFGIGCGIITAVIRLWGSYHEGVSYAILMMNAVTPLIDRYTKTRVYAT